ncbi:23S rRNA (pseudouridine(1915)-N(3))-methyltransferase RlmH [Alkalicaulis satelles]|uniref:Ribosomal RNA large subunit methyltransferase H n=1 Tax=Alkalicaulis satelles TaxID=2609175 RepID=A0A5M6ZFS8_9PROT|nr:23S rRNA (pseudouridine(1915)-N(3))-methyltransferase RlmH [Alkalicaulis satelles]KAA5803603.1 23S rRNA (pseudouridine(1915)-N(3))-methyltransferase RlmH [Alkalicaulis satelles]
MRAEIRAVGRLKAGPERTLVDDYLARATAQGRALGLGPFTERETDPRSLKDRAAETAALLDALEPGAAVFVLDETGRTLGSADFSGLLARHRDEGVRQAVFLIGGADGHERALLPAGARLISYGAATWPHKLVRVMLAEQLYRAVSLIAGSPYHREG